MHRYRTAKSMSVVFRPILKRLHVSSPFLQTPPNGLAGPLPVKYHVFWSRFRMVNLLQEATVMRCWASFVCNFTVQGCHSGSPSAHPSDIRLAIGRRLP